MKMELRAVNWCLCIIFVLIKSDAIAMREQCEGEMVWEGNDEDVVDVEGSSQKVEAVLKLMQPLHTSVGLRADDTN